MRNNLVKCPQCDLNFLSAEGMEKHQKRVHAPKESPAGKPTSFKCENCDELFSSKLDFKKHRDPQKLLCRKCQEDKQKFVCENKCELIKHVRKMHKKDLMMKKQNILESKKLQRMKMTRRHQCIQCNKVFKDNSFLELHMKEEHSGKEIKKEFIEKRQVQKNVTKQVTPAKETFLGAHTSQTPITPTTPDQPPPPSDQYYYKTFTAEELIKLGIFNEMSASQFVPPNLQDIQAQMEALQSQSNENNPSGPDPNYIAPNSFEGIAILGV